MSLYDLLQKPKPYEPGASIWTDEHIAAQMLSAHLDAATDAASYRPERMETVRAYLYDALKLHPGAKLVDLGCGPGLYAQYFAQKDVDVTGIDISGHSIDYAKEQARQAGLDITYITSDYRNSFGADCYNAAMCIYEDYGVLSPEDRAVMLRNVLLSLRSGGIFAFDVMSDAVWESLKEKAGWSALEKGFFRPYPHVVLNKTWLYPEERSFCNTHVVIDDQITVYHVHQTLFTPEKISKELETAGFIVDDIGSGLDGTPYHKDARQLGVIARKR